MAKTPKEIYQEIAEDSSVDPQFRIQACNFLSQIITREEMESKGKTFDDFGEIVDITTGPLVERLDALEKDIKDALEVFRHLSDKAEEAI